MSGPTYYRVVDPGRASELERELAAVLLMGAAIDALVDNGEEDEAGELREALNTLAEDLGIEDPAAGNGAEDDYVFAVARDTLDRRIAEEQC
jgi:hypothetical protein